MKLYICPTPIGNLEDITLRTINVLKEVDFIAAEDTRRTLSLLNHLEIKKGLTSYYEHNKDKKGIQIIERIKSGESCALVSDAGMPGISDPGEDLVKLCIKENIEFEVLPGAVAFITALVGSGLDTTNFYFRGFLSRGKKEKKKELEELKYQKGTVIFYESPHRIKETLNLILDILGNRKACIARELTKKYEEYIRGNIDELILQMQNKDSIRGEFVLMIEGSNESKDEEGDSLIDKYTIKEEIILKMDEGLSKKDAIKSVSKRRNLKKSEVYKESIDI
ncbi:16S rRNA (cytidine(1402)-2'-O)-methyltransferase [Peptostreptococcaceae bacterium AGR-M142]